MAGKVQVVTHGDVPVAVVLPYLDYQKLVKAAQYHSKSRKYAVPQDVAEMILVKDYTPIKAWRTYIGLSQKELAQRLKMTQAAFSQIENCKKNQMVTLKKVAAELGIHVKQLCLTD